MMPEARARSRKSPHIFRWDTPRGARIAAFCNARDTRARVLRSQCPRTSLPTLHLIYFVLLMIDLLLLRGLSILLVLQ
jgi:hypothetical protein